MKNVLILLVVIAVFMMGSTLQAATIAGSSHDLSTGGGITDKSTDEDQICVFCHTPHQTDPNQTDPLWNHTTTTNTNYGFYESATFDGGGGQSIADIGSAASAAKSSLLCMSCHDGTLAVNDLYNPANDTPGGTPTMGSGNELNAAGNLTNAANLGSDLSDDHPVNFDFADSFASDGAAAWNANVTNHLIGGKVQCASCHNVHDPQYVPFLSMDNTSSALCLDCHQK